MKNFKGIIILLGLIMACLIALSVFLTIELMKRNRDQGNPTEPTVTTATTGAASETTGTEVTQTATGSETVTTAPTTTAASETSIPTTRPTATETAATTTPVFPGLITLEEAESIALSQFDGDVRVVEHEDHTGDNPPHYELELTDGSYDYEIKIHALTGAIIDYEREPIDVEDDETGS